MCKWIVEFILFINSVHMLTAITYTVIKQTVFTIKHLQGPIISLVHTNANTIYINNSEQQGRGPQKVGWLFNLRKTHSVETLRRLFGKQIVQGIRVGITQKSHSSPRLRQSKKESCFLEWGDMEMTVGVHRCHGLLLRSITNTASILWGSILYRIEDGQKTDQRAPILFRREFVPWRWGVQGE